MLGKEQRKEMMNWWKYLRNNYYPLERYWELRKKSKWLNCGFKIPSFIKRKLTRRKKRLKKSNKSIAGVENSLRINREII